MPYAICQQHGAQAAELVTANVMEAIHAKSANQTINIRPVTLVYEQIEYSAGFATDEDFFSPAWMEAARTQKDGEDILEFDREDALENALGLFTAVCIQCLDAVYARRGRTHCD
jgi:hypothetical protein